MSARRPPVQNFRQIRMRRASLQIGKIYAKFLFIYIYFSETHLQVTALGRFFRAIAQTTWSRARMCLLRVKKTEINI